MIYYTVWYAYFLLSPHKDPSFLLLSPFISEQALVDSTILINKNNEQKDSEGGQSPHGIRLAGHGLINKAVGGVKSGADSDSQPDV